ncbi:MAG: cation:proton antiporter, partial [Ilumatobacteraceae bacterium]
MLAASGSVDLARLLLDLLIVIAVAKIAAEVAERIRIPAVLGEIAAGIAIGPSALGLVDLQDARGVSLGMLAELGVLLLLLQVGMEMDLGELRKVGRASLLVGIVGVAVPFAAGAAVSLAFVDSGTTAVFLGAALTATSVGITARVLGDLRALSTTEARIVLGAAVADDVLGLVILTVVVKVVSGGSVDATTVLSTLGLAVVFLLATGVVGLTVVPRLLDAVHRRSTSPAAVTTAATAVMLGFAMLADQAKLAFIIGAFMAGLGIAKSRHHERIARDLGSVGSLCIPVFFALIGVNADLEALGKPSVLAFASVLSVVAVIGKLVAAAGAIGTRADRLLIGLGMIPRGEVGLIFASIGLSTGVLGGDEYGALVIVVLATTVLTPPLLRWRLGAQPGTTPVGTSAPVAETSAAPSEQWARIERGAIVWTRQPDDAQTTAAALSVASLAALGRPSDEVLGWFAQRRTTLLTWTHSDTPALARLLRASEPRAWRFLEASGVLERALPEVAAALVRRRADMGDLDPVGALRFEIVDRLDQLAERFGLPSDDVVLAGLAADVCADLVGDADECCSALIRRLVDDDTADRITTLVADARMLRHGVARVGALDERDLLQVATHLHTPDRLHGAHHLAVALGPLEIWQQELLAERIQALGALLAHPESHDPGATNLAATRRLAAEHLLEMHDRDMTAPIERLRFASDTYLLSHDAESLARHARLIEPLPRPGNVRVEVTPDPRPDHWIVDVACRDRRAVLALLTSSLATEGLDIAGASIATWPDGGVLDSFVVRHTDRPSARTLATAFESALSRRPPRPTALTGVSLEIDNGLLPWHTSVIVRGDDRPGLLRSVTAAFAASGIVVHAARVDTVDGVAVDRFDVSDR